MTLEMQVLALDIRHDFFPLLSGIPLLRSTKSEFFVVGSVFSYRNKTRHDCGQYCNKTCHWMIWNIGPIKSLVVTEFGYFLVQKRSERTTDTKKIRFSADLKKRNRRQKIRILSISKAEFRYNEWFDWSNISYHPMTSFVTVLTTIVSGFISICGNVFSCSCRPFRLNFYIHSLFFIH
jgi:protein tyrosine phosphatase